MKNCLKLSQLSKCLDLKEDWILRRFDESLCLRAQFCLHFLNARIWSFSWISWETSSWFSIHIQFSSSLYIELSRELESGLNKFIPFHSAEDIAICITFSRESKKLSLLSDLECRLMLASWSKSPSDFICVLINGQIKLMIWVIFSISSLFYLSFSDRFSSPSFITVINFLFSFLSSFIFSSNFFSRWFEFYY